MHFYMILIFKIWAYAKPSQYHSIPFFKIQTLQIPKQK
jgi:hypothetical protein